MFFFIQFISSYAQEKNTFEFTDSTFKSGQIKEIEYIYFLCGKINESDLKTFDSIKVFLKKHDHIFLELGTHFSNGSIKRTYEYGNVVKKELGYRGADTSRIIVKGYGHTKHLRFRTLRVNT